MNGILVLTYLYSLSWLCHRAMPCAGQTLGWEYVSSGVDSPVSAVGRDWAAVSEPPAQAPDRAVGGGTAFVFS